MNDNNKEDLILAARKGDVERILDVLEDIHEKYCNDESKLQTVLDSNVFSIRDSDGMYSSSLSFPSATVS